MSARAAGFTLIEILVSLVLLQVGLLGVAGMTTVAARTLNRARDVEWAVHEARAVADSLVRFGASGSGELQAGFGTVRWEIAGGEPLAHARILATGTPGRTLVDVSLLVPSLPGGSP